METIANVDRPTMFIEEAILNPANSRKLLTGNEKQETLQKLGQEIKDFNAVQTETLLKKILKGLSTDNRYWTQDARESALTVLPTIDLQKIVPKDKIFDHYSSAVINILDLSVDQLDPFGQFDALLRAGVILAPYIASSGYGKAEIDDLINELKRKANLYSTTDAKYLLDQIGGLKEKIYNYEIEQEKDEEQGREELANQVKTLQDAGLSFTEIANQLGESIQAVVDARQPESDQNDLSLVQIPGSNMPNIRTGDTPDSIVTSIHETKAESKDGYLTPEQQKALNLLQEKVKKSVMQYLDQKQTGDLSPLVAMATGIGKGRIIHLLIEEQMRKKPDSKVLIIVGTKNILVKQSITILSEYQQLGKMEDTDEYVEAESEDELVEETTDIEENPLEGQTSSEYTTGRIGDINTNVHLATIQTTHSRITTNRLNPDDYDLVIVDEVHNVGTPKRKNAIDRFRRVAGFTATPHRNSGILIAPEEYGFTIIESFPLPEAQNAGFIPPLLGVQINTKNLLSEVPTNAAGRINYRKLEKLLKDSPDLLPYIADRIERLIISPEGRSYKTIIAVNFVWEAEELANLLNKAGFRVGVAVHQEATRSIHTEDIPAIDSIERYHLPEDDPRSIDILISPHVASEGFDAPFTEIVVWASPTQSGLRYTQFTGRVTRRFPGKPFGLVIDCLYQTSQHAWSYNMGRWLKGHVVGLGNGLLYLGPKEQLESIKRLSQTQAVEQQLIQEERIPLVDIQDSLEKVQETDAPFTSTWLDKTFIGGWRGNRFLAAQVIQELEEDNNNQQLVKRRQSAPVGVVTVVTDKNLFIKKLQEKGARLKPKEVIETIKETDAPITHRWLSDTFFHTHRRSKFLADQVIGELGKDENTRHLVKKGRNRGKTFTVVRDKNLFINMMVEKGARLKDILGVQETDAVITASWLTNIFFGEFPKLKFLAYKIVHELGENEDTMRLIKQRKSGSRIITAVTDKDFFIRYMVEKGVRLR